MTTLVDIPQIASKLGEPYCRYTAKGITAFRQPANGRISRVINVAFAGLLMVSVVITVLL